MEREGLVVAADLQEGAAEVGGGVDTNGSAYRWLSRGLEEALVAFIGRADGPGAAPAA